MTGGIPYVTGMIHHLKASYLTISINDASALNATPALPRPHLPDRHTAEFHACALPYLCYASANLKQPHCMC